MREYHDTIVLGADGDVSAAELTSVARRVLAREYPHSTLLGVTWTFATTPAEVDAWPLPHDCDDCRDGKTKAKAALISGDARRVALGNMHCEEPEHG